MIKTKNNKIDTPSKPRPRTEMAILEHPMEWLKDFRQGWLAHFEATGETDWKKYVRLRNVLAPSGKGIKLAESRLMLISSAGGYLTDSQKRFDDDNLLGDYSLRRLPFDTPFEQISFAHTHYKHEYVDADPQVLLPLEHLKDMVDEGIIGEVSPTVISFMGYQPNVLRIVKELIPNILKITQEQAVRGVLLVPA